MAHSKAKIEELRIKDNTLISMRAFHKSIDWAEWWTEFNNTLTKDGNYLYKTISNFIDAKQKNRLQRSFLFYYLGHKGQEEDKRFSFIEPQGWAERRRSGGWFSQESMAKFAKGVRSKFNALDALREAGDGVIFNYLARIENLAKALDESFKGQLSLPGLSLKENMARNECYFSMHARLIGLLDHAFHLYAKAHGINFSDMDGFAAIMKAQIESTARANPQVEKTGTENFLFKLVEMSMNKAAQYKLPLPKDAEEIIDTTVVTEINSKKKNVQ